MCSIFEKLYIRTFYNKDLLFPLDTKIIYYDTIFFHKSVDPGISLLNLETNWIKFENKNYYEFKSYNQDLYKLKKVSLEMLYGKTIEKLNIQIFNPLEVFINSNFMQQNLKFIFNTIEKHCFTKVPDTIISQHKHNYQATSLLQLGININFSYEFTKTAQILYNLLIKLLENGELYFLYNPFTDYWKTYPATKEFNKKQYQTYNKILTIIDQSYYKIDVKVKTNSINNISWPPKGSYSAIYFYFLSKGEVLEQSILFIISSSICFIFKHIKA